MDSEKRFELVIRNTQEIITASELKSLLETNAHPKAYWGVEQSGKMHIGMGLVCGRKIKDMVEAGFDFIIFLADWHSWINNKLGGKMENIRACGEYFKAAFKGLGLPEGRVRYLWASELAGERSYWEKVIRIGKVNSMQRIWRALPIMGRTLDSKDVEAAATFYPCMQAADIFQMELDLAYAGIDQRKAHVLARESADELKAKKPVCLHTPLLMDLRGPTRKTEGKFDENKNLSMEIGLKMSKSVPESAIFVHDSPEIIVKKIKAAYCPAKEVKNNPILQYSKYIVFTELEELRIERSAKFGGPVSFDSYEKLESAYRKGAIHPLDLKTGVGQAIAKILEGVRAEFERNPEPLERMERIEVTR